MGLIIFLVIGLIAGFLASYVMGRKQDLLVNLLVGVVGAVVGGLIAGAVGIGATGPIGEIIIVACRLPQHSAIFGQAASSQTVARRCALMISRVLSKAPAPGALTRIQEGLGSTGVSGRRAFSG